MTRLLPFVFILFAATILAETPAPGKARWLWTHEKFENSRNAPRQFRTEFTAEDGIRKALLFYVYDDTCTLSINGVNVEGNCPIQRKAWPKRADVTAAVRPGRNAIAAEVVNTIGLGGIIVRLEIEYKDGRILNIYSDGSWKCTRKPVGNWRLPGFDDSKWEAANAFSTLSENIWAYIYPMNLMRDREETRALNELYRRRELRGRAILKSLENAPRPVCTAFYSNGRAMLKIGEKAFPIILYSANDHTVYDDPTWRKQTALLARSGILLHSVTINVTDAIWKKDGTVDVNAAAKVLQDYLEMAPDVYLSVGINLSRPPYWWRAKHPDECIDYANGGRNLKEAHVQRNYVAPSYASKVWNADAQALITKIVRHLEGSPLAARIFSYRMDSGIYTEWHYYGMPGSMPDCSRPMTEAFRRFLKRKYATEAALRKAWGDDEASFEHAETPDKEARLATGAGHLRSSLGDRKVLDYLECMGEVERDCVLGMNRAAREASGGRVLVGNYHGYFFGMNYPAEGWHLRNDEILEAPEVGFQISPNQYGQDFRDLGKYGSPRSLVDTYRLRGKFCILEADTRTHLEPNTGGHTFARNEEESVALLARDFAHAFAHGCGLWFMDFSKSWYMTPKLQEFFLNGASSLIRQEGDFSSAAEVAVIGDFDSVPFHAVEKNPNCANYAISMETPRELGACQIPYDMLSFADLSNPNQKPYKVYIFLNAYLMTPKKRAVVDKLKRNGKTLVWTHVPGYFTEHSASLKGTSELTGFSLKELTGDCRPRLFLRSGNVVTDTNKSLPYSPVAVIADKQAEILGDIAKDGKRHPAFAWKRQDGWNSVLCTTPYLPRQAIKAILDKAGVFRYCDSPDAAVYANASMVMLHTGTPGTYTLHFPAKVTWRCFFPENRTLAEHTDTITLEATGKSTYFFSCTAE